jgi:hypothetical protein
MRLFSFSQTIGSAEAIEEIKEVYNAETVVFAVSGEFIR